MMFTYTPTAVLESDDALRKRIVYVADDGFGQRLSHEIANASGERLDEIASRYNLRRRA
jgi:hypothetical protein